MHFSFISLHKPGVVYRIFRPFPGLQLLSLCLLLCLYGLTLIAVSSLLEHFLVFSDVFEGFVNVLSAGLSLWSWSYWVLAPAPARRLNCCAQAGSGAAAAFLWSIVWLTLPAWAFLKVVAVTGFVPFMAWRWMRNRSQPQAWGAVLGWVASLSLLSVFLFWGDGSRMSRWVASVWPMQPDVLGRHYQWAQAKNALAHFSMVGDSSGSFTLPSVLSLPFDDAGVVLRLGLHHGWFSMGIVGVGVVSLWLFLAAWLFQSPVGRYLGRRARAVAVTLSLVHALGAALYVAWSFAIVYRPMGAFSLFSNAGWGTFHLALAWLVWRTMQQRSAKRRQRGVSMQGVDA